MDAKAVAETAGELFKNRFGYAPDNKDPKKKAEWVLWRYGGQGFEDAVKVIRALRSAAMAADPLTIARGLK
jgi:hypothetical protein